MCAGLQQATTSSWRTINTMPREHFKRMAAGECVLCGERVLGVRWIKSAAEVRVWCVCVCVVCVAA